MSVGGSVHKKWYGSLHNIGWVITQSAEARRQVLKRVIVNRQATYGRLLSKLQTAYYNYERPEDKKRIAADIEWLVANVDKWKKR